MSHFLDPLLGGVKTVADDAGAVPTRGVLKFTGLGVSVADDTVNNQTVVTMTGSGGGGGTPSDADPADVDQSPYAGTSSTYARGDHMHALSPATMQGIAASAATDWDFNGRKLQYLADGTLPQDALTLNGARKRNLAKQACYGATTGNIVLSGSSQSPADLDGIGPYLGVYRILVREQSLTIENGIYLSNPSGAWTRADDDDVINTPGDMTLVEYGTAYGGKVLVRDNYGQPPGPAGTTDNRWREVGSSGGGGPVDIVDTIYVANIAALIAYPIDPLKIRQGTRAWVTSLRTYFWYDTEYYIATDGINAVGPGGSQWLRDLSYKDFTWVDNTSWTIDPVGGNDENIANLATLGEWYRRTGGRFARSGTTITLIGNGATPFPGGDPGAYTVEYIGDTLGAAPNSLAQFIVQGALSYLSAGTVTAFTKVDPVAGNANELETSATLIPGDCIRFSSGPLNGNTFFVTKALGANKYRLTDNGAHTLITPADPGDTFNVLDLVQVRGNICSRGHHTQVINFGQHLLDVASGTTNDFIIDSRISTNTLGSVDRVTGTRHNYQRCCFTAVHAVNTQEYFNSCGFLDRVIFNEVGQGAQLLTCVHEGHIWVGGNPAQSNTLNTHSVSVVGCCFFGSDYGVVSSNNSNVSVQSSMFGSVGYVGARATNGGHIYFTAGGTYTIAGATQNLMLSNGTTALPNLEASAGAVIPALSAMTTYADLTAAPFAGSAVNYKDLSSFTVT